MLTFALPPTFVCVISCTIASGKSTYPSAVFFLASLNLSKTPCATFARFLQVFGSSRFTAFSRNLDSN